MTIGRASKRLEGGVRLNRVVQQGEPLISVITAVYNGAQYIEQTIQSVLSQSFNNFEYVVVDGGSTDGTIEIIKKFEDRIDYWFSEADSGIYDAWNKGLSAARGEWISFLGSDDAYYERALEAYARFIADNVGKDFEYISSRVDLVTSEMEQIQVIGTPWQWETFRKRMKVAHVGSLHHRNLYDRYGLYDTNFKITGDYELLLRPREALRAGFIDVVTAMMRNGGASHNVVRAYTEAKQAKHQSGRRNLMQCTIDNAIDMTKVTLKKIFLKRYRA